MTERWVKYTDEKDIIRWVNMSNAAAVSPCKQYGCATVVSLLVDPSNFYASILAKEPPELFLPAKEPPELFLPAKTVAPDDDWGEGIKSITLDSDTLRTGYCEGSNQIMLHQGGYEIVIPESMFDKLFEEIKSIHLRRERKEN